MKMKPPIDNQEEVKNVRGGEVKLGDLIWVTIPPSSWWPAQVVDAHTVSDSLKPKNRSVGEVLVRLYGSYNYLYVDPIKSRTDFHRLLHQTNTTHRRVFCESLEMDRPNSDSSSSKRKRPVSNVQVEALAPKKLKQNVLGDNSRSGASQTENLTHNGPGAKNDDSLKKLKPSPTPTSSDRRVKVMQSLGLAAPSGSPFRKVGRVYPIGD